MNSQVANLKAWVLSNYAVGGSWVYETYTDDDYEDALRSGFKAAKADLKSYWELMNSVSVEVKAA